MKNLRVIVAGAAGRMGREVIRAISSKKDIEVVGAVDIVNNGDDAGRQAGIEDLGVAISFCLKEVIDSTSPDVIVDFTNRDAAIENIRIASQNAIAIVVGTTGFVEQDYCVMSQWALHSPIFIVPNFSIGAVLMMRFAQEASKYFSWAEIVELHHEKKKDAPSGTAIYTLKKMLEQREVFSTASIKEEKISGVRGGENSGIRIHSIRLPGLMAHQEVIFGGCGETLTIRHDSLNRESFIPGVLMAIRKVHSLKGLVVGLENIL